MNTKYLLLYLKTGGGHLSTARTVAKSLAQQSDNKAQTIMHDGLDGAPAWLRYALEDGYRHSQSQAPWVYAIIYAFHKIKPLAAFTAWWIALFIRPALERAILAQQPHKIVIFHFFLIKPILYIVKKHQLNIPVLTVVTDPYTAAPIWFLERQQNFVVFSHQLHQQVSKTITPDKLKVLPFVIDDRFTQNAETQQVLAIKQKLGLAQHARTVLVIGGGDGMRNGDKIVLQLAQTLQHDVQIIIVCGRNNMLLEKSQQIAELYPNIRAFGFVDFVHELIQASDVVITKCGPSTVMEILLSRKVPIINQYLWEQEKGNMEFVRNNNMGIYERRIKKLPDTVADLLNNPKKYNHFVENIQTQNIRNGSSELAQHIINL